jgi:hypothetical protein
MYAREAVFFRDQIFTLVITSNLKASGWDSVTSYTDVIFHSNSSYQCEVKRMSIRTSHHIIKLVFMVRVFHT